MFSSCSVVHSLTNSTNNVTHPIDHFRIFLLPRGLNHYLSITIIEMLLFVLCLIFIQMLISKNSNSTFYSYPVIDDESWTIIKEYEEAFRPFYKVTKLMQTLHQSFSEFYIQWLNGVRELKLLKNNRFVTPLSNGLMNRLNLLKDSQLFRAALYLDPRFNFLDSKVFSLEEKESTQVRM